MHLAFHMHLAFSTVTQDRSNTAKTLCWMAASCSHAFGLLGKADLGKTHFMLEDVRS